MSMRKREDPITCDLCGQASCDWDVIGEESWEECNIQKKNKAVSYHAYRMYTHIRHGVLHYFDQEALPVCIYGEIMDSWPDPNHEYIGF